MKLKVFKRCSKQMTITLKKELCSHVVDMDVEGAGGQLEDTEKVRGKVFEQADKCSPYLSAKKLSNQKWR